MTLRIFIFMISLLAAGGAGWLTLNMNNQPEIAAGQPQPRVEVPTGDVLVAVQPITAGEVLTADKLRWQAWPEPQINDQFVTLDEQPQAIPELTGTYVNRAFAAGEPIREDRLMETNANLLSHKIARGMRAVAVKITAENTAGGFILPGDRVDVIQTTTQRSGDSGATLNKSRMIISNVRVLAIDQTAVQTPEGSVVGQTATLELSPPDSEKIMSAEASGMLSLVLRAVTDHDIKETPAPPVTTRTVRVHRGSETTTVTLR